MLQPIKMCYDKAGPRVVEALCRNHFDAYYFSTREEAIEKIKTESRRYAKRQLTWFRRNPKINWVFNQEPVTFAKIWEQVQRIIGFDSIS